MLLILISIGGCSNKKTEFQDSITNTEDAMNYLRNLEGEWIATLENDNSHYGFEYILSARDNVIIERLRTDIPTEMLTVITLNIIH